MNSHKNTNLSQPLLFPHIFDPRRMHVYQEPAGSLGTLMQGKVGKEGERRGRRR